MPNWNRIAKVARELDNTSSEYFLSAGLDFKGQAQTGYTANGGGLSGSVSIDPGKVIGLSAEVGVNCSVTRAAETMLIVHRGPMSFEGSGAIDRPVIINCLAGAQWEGAVGASLEFGVSAELSVGVTTEKSEAKSEVKGYDDPEEEEEKSTCLEAVGASIGCKAGFSGSVGYTYSHFYAEDPLPLWFKSPQAANDGTGSIKTVLEAILEQGTTKAVLKRGVCKFISDNATTFGGRLEYDRWTGGHTSSATIVARLRAGMQSLQALGARINTAQKGLLADAELYERVLRVWAGDVPREGSSFLHLASHQPKASAAIKASAEAQANAAGLLKASVGAELTAISADYQAKYAFMRFQTALCTSKPTYATQDIAISYSQVKLAGLQLEVKAEASAFGETATKKKDLGSEKCQWDVLNRMTYEASRIYWERPERPGNVRALEGSGFSFGQSCVVKNLVKAVQSYDSVMEEFSSPWAAAFAQSVAHGLRVPVATFMAFLADLEIYRMLLDIYNQGRVQVNVSQPRTGPQLTPQQLREQGQRINQQYNLGGATNIDAWENKALLVESSFALPSGSTFAVTKSDSSRRVGGRFSGQSVTDERYILTDRARKQIYELPEVKSAELRQGLLQSIRLRFRIADAENNDKTRFTLGLKIAGTGAKISLLTVDRAGSEGIVDLGTVWMADKLKRGGKDAYEKAVPPVTLFSQ